MQHTANNQGNAAGNQSGNGSNNTSNRGFASMSPEKQREIASKGGRAAHQQGVAHQWSSDEARKAGKKGGDSVSQNRQHMAEIGRKGGQSSRGNVAGKNNTQNVDNNNADQADMNEMEQKDTTEQNNMEDSTDIREGE